MIYNDIDKLAEDFVRDIEHVTDPLQDFNAIELAMFRLNQDRPNISVEDVLVSDSNTAALPSAWNKDFSDISSIEYPIGSRTYLDAWSLYQTPTGFVIDLGRVVQGDIRVAFSTRHILHQSNPTLTTIPLELKEPLASYGAHLILMQLSGQYAHDTDSSIAIDSIDHGDKSRKFAALAGKYLKKYQAQVGIENSAEKSAGAVVNWQRPRLFSRQY